MRKLGGVAAAFPAGSAVFRNPKRFWTTIFGGIALLAIAPTANAGIIITMSEAGVVGPTVVDSTSLNFASFVGSFGDYVVSINTAVANSPGANNLATLNVSSTEIRGVALPGSSGILSIHVEATGFTVPAANTPVFFMQSIGSNSSDSPAIMTFQSFLDGSPAPLQGPLAHGTSDLSVTPFAGPLPVFPFNISNTTTILVSPRSEGATSGSTDVSNTPNFFPPPVPEPGSTVVWLAAAACLVGVNKLRKRWRMA